MWNIIYILISNPTEKYEFMKEVEIKMAHSNFKIFLECKF